MNQALSRSVILVTGASGFIGVPLCKALVMRGSTVRAAVRSMGKAKSLGGCEILEIDDISSIDNWEILLSEVDVIVHLAGRVHLMRDDVTDPLVEYRKINTLATVEMAKAAARNGVKKFIYLSSIKVNGEETSLNVPFTAMDAPNPKDPYGISKMEAEKSLMRLSCKSGMGVVIIRPPLVYGPGVKANFYTMMSWLIYRIPLPFGGIHNLRSLVSIDNLVDLILMCISHPSAINQIFLVSDGEDLSTSELLDRMGNALGSPARLIPVPVAWIYYLASFLGRRDMAQRLCASLRVDISKTRDVLGWSPKTSLDEGLKRTARAFLGGE